MMKRTTSKAQRGRQPAREKDEGEGLTTLRDLLIEELKDLYDAESQLVKALPKVVQAASSSELKEAIKAHLEQTRSHVKRLEQAFKQLGEAVSSSHCDAMEGLLEEGKHIMEEEGEESVIDAGIIAAAQKVEHYEIAGYGCVSTWAESLGESEVARVLNQTLEEEKEADEKLTEIAESTVNQAAKATA
jgi:ferritin-like metal-binding protein YciE